MKLFLIPFLVVNILCGMIRLGPYTYGDTERHNALLAHKLGAQDEQTVLLVLAELHEQRLKSVVTHVNETTGQSLLQQAATQARFSILEKIIAILGGQACQHADDGASLLHLIAQSPGNPSFRLISSMIQLGFCYRRQDADGYESIHYAVMYGKLHMLRALLSIGVPINVLSANGKSSLYLRMQVHREQDAFAHELRRHGALSLHKENRPWQVAIGNVIYNGQVVLYDDTHRTIEFLEGV